MSDRRPEKLYVLDGDDYVGANKSDLLAVVRRGVESGTIKGEVVEAEDCVKEHPGHSSLEVFELDPGTYIIVGPVSDGGEDRP